MVPRAMPYSRGWVRNYHFAARRAGATTAGGRMGFIRRTTPAKVRSKSYASENDALLAGYERIEELQRQHASIKQ